MQKHKLPSSSTIRQSALEQDGAASNIINVPPMHQTVTPIPVPTRTAAANEPSSLFAAALNLPDLAARKEMAFKKKTASSRSVSISREGSQAEASPSRPPPPAGASRHSGGLSAELSGPLAALDSVTASLRSRGKDGDADEARWKGTVKNLTVGRCGSISSSPLTAYANRLEYKFHSSGSCITMVMFYRDMDPSTASLNKTTLAFHISTPLIQFSSTDYAHSDPTDLLSITFFSIADAKEFERSVQGHLPLS